MTPDLILLAGTVHTLDPARHGPVRAVAVKDGRIAAVGTPGDAAGWRGPRTEVVDLGAAVLVPGLVDSHIHPVFGLELTAGADLSGAQDLAEVRRRLHAEAARTEPEGWVRGWGLDPNVAGGPALHRSLLDGMLGSRPVLVRLFDGHSALASSRALELAGVDGPRSFDQGAQVVCDADGPTGLLLEAAAMDLVARHLPAASFAERKAGLSAILQGLARAGLTGGHVMDHSEDAALLYRALEDEGELPLRLRCAPWCQPGTGETGWAALAEQIGTGGRRWSVEAVKLFIDGTVDNGTAWLFEPDRLGESAVPFWPRPQEYSAAVRYFASRGVPTATHAIGDAGVAHVLAALDAAGEAARRQAVHRIEHLETVPDELVARFAELGVVASMQPTHCTHYSRADQSDNWSARLGPVRAGRAWRCRDLRDLGVTVALGSDWPIAPYEPLPVIADAQLRRRAGRPGLDPIVPGQALTALQALEGYTSQAAKAAGLWASTGSISPGKLADFTVLEADPLTTEPDVLAASTVIATFVGGVQAVRAPAAVSA